VIKLNITGPANLDGLNLKVLYPIQFHAVTEFFTVCDNNLTSLKGTPEWVGGNFWCSYNDLLSFEDAPKYIGGDFHGTGNYNAFKHSLDSKIAGKIYW